jgi:hypothetical protein
MTLLYKTAQSLTEYSLVIGLVALACIGGVALLSTQVQDRLGNTLGNTAPGGSSVVQIPKALAAPFTQQSGFLLSQEEIQSILDQSPTQTIDLGNGKSIKIPQPNLNELQETLGPNGSSEVALAVIQRMQEALKSQGIDPATVIPELAEFSNAGHTLSVQQANTEAKLANVILFGEPPPRSARDSEKLTSYAGRLNIEFGSYNTPMEQILRKDSSGNFFITINSADEFDNPHVFDRQLNDLAPPSKLILLNNSVRLRLEGDHNLKSLIQPFNQAFNTIVSNHESLKQTLNEANTKIQTGTPLTSTTSGMPYWLSTKMESNKTCLMSKDQTCLK